MVVVLPGNFEKAEPPPYSEVLESSPSSTSIEIAQAPSRSTGKKHLRVVRIQEDIRGHWEIDASSLPTTSPPSGSSSSSKSPSVYFETQNGVIDASMSWVDSSPGRSDGRICLPRVMVEANTRRGDLSITTHSRPHGLPLHIKTQAQWRGNVKICVPPAFRGILALRYQPIVPDAPRSTYIALGTSIRDQVVCTRETAPTGKGKGKQDKLGSQSVLVEFLIGTDLETSDLNKSAESGPDALDLVEAEVGDGRIMVLSADDLTQGDAAFLESEETHDEVKHDASRTWTWPGHVTPGFSVSMDNRGRDLHGSGTAVSIVIEEPKWLGYAKKKWTKLGQSVSTLPIPNEKGDLRNHGNWKGLLHGAHASSVSLATTGHDYQRGMGMNQAYPTSPPKRPCPPVPATAMGSSQSAYSPPQQLSPNLLRLPGTNSAHMRRHSAETHRPNLGREAHSYASETSQTDDIGHEDYEAGSSRSIGNNYFSSPSPNVQPPPQDPSTVPTARWPAELPTPPLHPTQSLPAPSTATHQTRRPKPIRRRSRSVSAQDWSPDTSPELSRTDVQPEQEYFEPLPMQHRDRRAFTTGSNPYSQRIPDPAHAEQAIHPRPDLSVRLAQLSAMASDSSVPVRENGRLELRAQTLPRARSATNLRALAEQDG
ncbi:hypothetical protein FRB93_012862 [Tulasnella sp. JGI-2019a]|nr:hypothetical protein FRB93_012862 [Tulasnella sp. JGI-2019a]